MAADAPFKCRRQEKGGSRPGQLVLTYGLSGGGLPEPAGVLRPGNGYIYDTRKHLHEKLPLLLGDKGDAAPA